MSSNVVLYYRLPDDKAQQVRDEYFDSRRRFLAQLSELVRQDVESVSMRGNYAMRVSRVASVEFVKGVVPDGRWKLSKDVPDEWIPNLRRKAGRELGLQLEQFNGPTIYDALDGVGIVGTYVNWDKNHSVNLGVESHEVDGKAVVVLATTAKARQYFTLPDWLIPMSGQEVAALMGDGDE